MTTEVSKEIAAILQELSNRFGTTAEHLWNVLVRQAYITGAIELAIFIVWVIALWRVWAKHFGHKYEDDACQMGGLIGLGAVTFLTAFIIGVSLSTTVGSIINPEYWALDKILRGFK